MVFRRLFTPEEGLGPRFNENACNACHTDPADGGTGEQFVTKATRYLPDGRCDMLSLLGGENLRIQATPALLATGEARRVPVPAEATHVGRFTVPFLFGLGLVDAIDTLTLLANADPDDMDGDGISGRLGRDWEGRPARFGRKADAATLHAFSEGASRLEMGLTTPEHPDEASAGAIPSVPEGTDPAPEPELDARMLAAVTDFVRFLAPPVQAPPLAPADSNQVARGQRLFEGLGCASCHVPVLTTGPNPVAAISERRIALYSDLLLHDMGAELAGSCAAGASPAEYRTEPLMGLRYRTVFLHDGRARRVINAILLHGGEADTARNAFAALERTTQELLLRYLGTL